MFRFNKNIYTILMVNRIVSDGRMELNEDGSNDEKMSGIMSKHR